MRTKIAKPKDYTEHLFYATGVARATEKDEKEWNQHDDSRLEKYSELVTPQVVVDLIDEVNWLRARVKGET